jgi:hypothetical protein
VFGDPFSQCALWVVGCDCFIGAGCRKDCFLLFFDSSDKLKSVAARQRPCKTVRFLMNVMLMTKDEKKDLELKQPEVQQSTAEERAKATEAFMQEHTKKVAVEPLADDVKAKFQEAITALQLLKEDVLAKKASASEKNEAIKEKAAWLKATGKVNLDDNEFNRSDKSVAEYARLLDKMIAEIDQDSAFYSSLISQKPPEHITVFKFESDSFQDHIKQRLMAIKKYIKTAKRDLAISFSRYNYGFDAQLRQLEYIETVIKNADKKDSSAS